MSNGSNGPARRISPMDVQVVQNLIERCLHRYMSRGEVVQTLLDQAKIEPCFTELVWQMLEKGNPEFFKAYYLRLMVTKQIYEFNKLIKEQIHLMQQSDSSVPSMSASNGSHDIPLHQNPAFYTTEHMVPAVNHSADSSLQNAFSNDGSPLLPNVHRTVDMSVHASRINGGLAMIPIQSSDMTSIQGLNGGMMKSVAGYSDASQYMLGPDGSVLQTRPLVDTTLPSFTSVESDSHALHGSFLGPDVSELGQLGQFPRTLSFSDIPADFTFTQSSDMLDNYSGQHFVMADNQNFVDSQETKNQGDNERLDAPPQKG